MAEGLVNVWEQHGLAKGRRQDIRIILEERFGPLDATLLEQLQNYPNDCLEDLLRASLKADSVEELNLAQEDDSSNGQEPK